MGYTRFEGKSETDLHTLFETHSEIRSCKYNIIVSRDSAKLMKIDVEHPTVDWILSKHVLISNYDESVRFAGEVWKDEKGIVWVNRNSGTYAPSREQLDACIEYLRAIFPHVTFQADYMI